VAHPGPKLESRRGNWARPGIGQPARGLSAPMERIISTKTPALGIIVGTYAALPYVHLQLESWRRNCRAVAMIVHDDCSPQGRQLKLLCDEYGAEFHSTPARRGHVVGDLSVYLFGLEWAAKRQIELLVKLSRRFVPLVEWETNLLAFAYESQYATYSGLCRHHGYGFRTECMAMHVPSWIRNGGAAPIRSHAEKGEHCLVEAVVHQGAQAVHRHNCEANRLYEALHPRPSHADGYGNWELLGENRCEARGEVMWHEACRPVEYHRAAIQYGIQRYGEADFRDGDANIR
jgi:hypothetical protein